LLKRVFLLFLLVAVSGCDHWVEKLAPESTGFAKHCFDLLQQHDFTALKALASPDLPQSELEAQLADLAAQIPAEAPISSEATSVNVNTTNGYTVSRVTMAYQFQSGWLEFDVSAEGSDTLAFSAMSLHPTTAPMAIEYLPALFAVPVVIVAAVLIGIAIHRRRRVRPDAPQVTATGPERMPAGGRIELLSPLSREVCAARLRDAVDSGWRIFGGKPAIGRVDESSFRIRKRLGATFHNSFQTYLTGRLESDGSGTRVQCRFGMHPFVRGFMALWFAMLLAFTAAGIMMGAHGSARGFPLVGIIGPAIMAVFGVGLVFFGRFFARNEQRFLLDFLAQTIEARPTATRQEPAMIERRAR
jgi:hypothetical protein